MVVPLLPALNANCTSAYLEGHDVYIFFEEAGLARFYRSVDCFEFGRPVTHQHILARGKAAHFVRLGLRTIVREYLSYQFARLIEPAERADEDKLIVGLRTNAGARL